MYFLGFSRTTVPLPFMRRTTPRNSSSKWILRAVVLLTPHWRIRALSDGTLAPGFKRPAQMSRAIEDAIKAYFGFLGGIARKSFLS
jgi:hypothetical protein